MWNTLSSQRWHEQGQCCHAVKLSGANSCHGFLNLFVDLLCSLCFGLVFTALLGMQTPSSDEKAVCPSVWLSVRQSVCLSNACIVTKRKKDLSRFLYHTKDHLALRRRMFGGSERPLLPEILSQLAPIGAKSSTLNRYSLVAPQP